MRVLGDGKELNIPDGADKQWTAALHEWKRWRNDGSANWLLLDSTRLFGDTFPSGYDDR